MRKLSNLKAIQAFEAAARNQSYVGAAQELHVTPAAIGQQVRALEAWIGKPLFHRLETGSQRMVLTADAQLVVADFRDGLDKLERGLRRLREARSDSVITVSASQAFVAKWLMPRLDGFTSAHAGLDIRLDVTDRLVDLAHGDADIAVRCGAGHWPGVRAVKLMDEEIFPVCSPLLLKNRQALTHASDLLRYTLIHDMTTAKYDGFPSWQMWLERAEVKTLTAQRGPEINASSAVIQAAINGQGVALARGILVQDDLASGRLVRLLKKIRHPIEWAYYVVYVAERESAPQVNTFLNWIVKTAKNSS
jgi:LysR family transcriptional regulator, glycine cleavage system transcriptional activator